MLKLSQDKKGTVDLLSGFKHKTNVTYILPCHQNTQKGPASTVLLRMSWLLYNVVISAELDRDYECPPTSDPPRDVMCQRMGAARHTWFTEYTLYTT